MLTDDLAAAVNARFNWLSSPLTKALTSDWFTLSSLSLRSLLKDKQGQNTRTKQGHYVTKQGQTRTLLRSSTFHWVEIN